MQDSRKTKKQLLEEIQELRRKIRELENREATSLLLLQNPNSIILRIDPTGKVLFANDFAQAFFGFTENELKNRNITRIIFPEHGRAREDFEAVLEETVKNPGNYRSFESENITQNGMNVFTEWTLRALTDGEGEVTEILCIGNDITRQKYIEEQLVKASTTDLVTGLHTRSAFTENFEKEKYRFSRNGKPFSIILGTITNYRECVDSHGPECGDAMVKKIADTMRESLRMSDVGGRWSSEEFIILLPETNIKGGVVAAEKIKSAVTAAPIECDGSTIPVSLTLCVGVYDREMKLEDFIDRVYDVLDEIEAAGGGENRVVTIEN